MSTSVWCFGIVSLIGTAILLAQDECFSPAESKDASQGVAENLKIASVGDTCDFASCGPNRKSPTTVGGCCTGSQANVASSSCGQLRCTLSDRAKEERVSESRKIFDRAKRVAELDNGYRWEFANSDDQLVRELAEWIVEEQDCCSFFEYQLTVLPSGEVTFALTGREGVKAFIADALIS